MKHPLRVVLNIFVTTLCLMTGATASAQINTDQVMRIGRNAIYFEDYVLSIQYFNQVIGVKPYLAQPYFYRAIAKLNLDDYDGARRDASLAIERNPFITDAYEVRGVANQNLGNNAEAITDYDKALEMLPDNRSILYNKSMAQQEIKDYDGARASLKRLLEIYPSYANAYMGRARLNLATGDTVAALADIDTTLTLDKNVFNAYIMRADIAISRSKDYASALTDMDEAIRLQPQTAGLFINRAFLRYSTDDYFGAMADYDYALQLEPDNATALFNRGLLRAEVRDNNRAIDDFTAVIALNPDDHKAHFNRANLYRLTGDYRGALADLDDVIKAYPKFSGAIYLRAQVNHLLGRSAAAERDRRHAIALAKTRVSSNPLEGSIYVTDKESATATDDTADDTGDDTMTQEEIQRRFTSLTTIADNTTATREYNNSDIRGRVQDNNITIEHEPIFVVTYYISPTELKLGSDYIKEVDDINATRILRDPLKVTNHPPRQSDSDVLARHLESITYYNSYISTHTPRAIDLYGRAMDYITIRDYDAAIADLDRAIELTPDFALAYLTRANTRHQQALIAREQAEDTPTLAPTHHRKTGTAADATAIASRQLDAAASRETTKQILADLDHTIALSPMMAIAHYNKGVILLENEDYTGALSAFNRAIELRPDFGEACYNRGYVYLRLGNRTAGMADLSRAGELGILPSYNLLKRMSR